MFPNLLDVLVRHHKISIRNLQRETVTLDELKAIADVLGIKFEQAFILPGGNEINISNE
ncbi:hypothetical protein STRINF_01753 [Streptococcus infantarius subsp. infantarius ATCC BAA-102]|uniref:XRE family transcriptional regulator n=1 Tax=Streptococcus infantarius subsp. infantarius ATCC BAA-102 TaxID=471872 RepID=A0ABM9XCB7_9STRE|nr:hypothetical protein STRINF_01753 [Streptococcus infantarius subsp. infantarius ATCC BAA-102]